ncbi:hypothetical protein AAFF_G00216500 [Aldrovandia affinis]|uniref:RING-type domain-containing protein n=1 Tax=Aldrovandia affinis TaxID=143900 RepID=A0AAD7RGD9_9TELE|nr:hypothetical protein AAFF_G00216500 [Aldrovandia affinis]
MEPDVDWSLALEDDAQWTSGLEKEMSDLDISEGSSAESQEHPTPSGRPRRQRRPIRTASRPPAGPETPPQQGGRCAQTDAWTSEAAVNTNQDWESLMRQVEERSTHLALQYEALLKQQEADQVQHDGRVRVLEQQREEDNSKQQALFNKVESLQVKLKLNCCKTTRKNFTAKKRDLTKEKDRLEEEKNRLSQNLEETDRRLTALIEEQSQEKLAWERELAELQKEADRLRKEADEASQVVLRDELSALEIQREVTILQVDEWIAEAERYLHALRLDVSQQHFQQRLDWEKNVAVVRSNLGNLQQQFNEQLQLLQQGQQLDSLPPISLPPLPQVPTLELVLGSMMTPRPLPFMPMQMGPPHPHHHGDVLSPPVGKLDKLLDKLVVRFPHCSRNQLISMLQQIKTSRSGTLAGLSMEELSQQVAQRLAQMERPSLGPIGPPSAARNLPSSTAQVQRAVLPPQGPAVAQVFQTRPPPQPVAPSTRKMCMMCQNFVDPGTQHEISCSHVIHKECISVWLQTTKNNSCPFCPSK